MATISNGSNEVTPPGPPTENGPTLTRGDVAAILGCSISSVRRLEGDILHPVLDADGVHRFFLLEVLQVQKTRSARAVGATQEGMRDSRAFEVFDAGGGIRDVVTQVRIPVDLAERLYEAWRRAGARDVVVTPQIRAQLESYLGTITDVRDLVQRAREQAAANEYLHSERGAMVVRIDEIAIVIGFLVARIPALADALPDLREKLGSEASETLDRAVQHATKARRSSVDVADAAATAPSPDGSK